MRHRTGFLERRRAVTKWAQETAVVGILDLGLDDLEGRFPSPDFGEMFMPTVGRFVNGRPPRLTGREKTIDFRLTVAQMARVARMARQFGIGEDVIVSVALGLGADEVNEKHGKPVGGLN